jgi:hypothetical protein
MFRHDWQLNCVVQKKYKVQEYTKSKTGCYWEINKFWIFLETTFTHIIHSDARAKNQNQIIKFSPEKGRFRARKLQTHVFWQKLVSNISDQF